jgi:hypothetical protein
MMLKFCLQRVKLTRFRPLECFFLQYTRLLRFRPKPHIGYHCNQSHVLPSFAFFFSMVRQTGHPQSHGSGFNQVQQSQLSPGLEPVAPLELSANRWTAGSTSRKSQPIDPDVPELVDRKVKGLVNKLTMEKFDSISDQIITWANKSGRSSRSSDWSSRRRQTKQRGPGCTPASVGR